MTPIRHFLLLATFLLTACTTPPPNPFTPPTDPVNHPEGPRLDSTATQIGASREGRPIYARRHGTGPTRLLVIGLIHGDEPEVFERFDQLWLRLTTAGYGKQLELAAIATMNPDGYEQRRRGNAKGVDLNRNWPAPNFRPSGSHGPEPLSEPETAAVHRHMLGFDPEVVIVFHSTPGGPFVDPDGPSEPGERLANAFVRAAQAIDPAWRVHADFTNPAGSLGTWYGLDQQRVVLTVEYRPGTNPDTALSSATAGVLAVMREMVRP